MCGCDQQRRNEHERGHKVKCVGMNGGVSTAPAHSHNCGKQRYGEQHTHSDGREDLKRRSVFGIATVRDYGS